MRNILHFTRCTYSAYSAIRNLGHWWSVIHFAISKSDRQYKCSAGRYSKAAEAAVIADTKSNPVVCSKSVDAAKMAVQSFVSTRLDYCNSLMYGIADGLMQRLQAVQNAAARLITGARRRDHISPVLRQLHWLPVRRVQFKLAVLVFKALHGQAPQCLTDDCQLITAAGRRQLRSSDAVTFSATDPRRALKTHLFDCVWP